MISYPYVKGRLVTLCRARAEYESVSVLYGPPEAGERDLNGTDPIMRQSLQFDAPDGLMRVDEMCGPLRQDYIEDYEFEAVVQVIARNRDATPAVVEGRRSLLAWGLVQALQDSTLGYSSTLDTQLISQIYVDLSDTLSIQGWGVFSGTNLYAARTHLTVHVEAQIRNE